MPFPVRRAAIRQDKLRSALTGGLVATVRSGACVEIVTVRIRKANVKTFVRGTYLTGQAIGVGLALNASTV